MKSRIPFSILLSLAMLLLASCAQLNPFPGADINAGLVGSQIEYTVTISEEEDDDGNVTETYNLVVSGAQLRAYANPGSVGVTIERYAIEHFYADGTRVPTAAGSALTGTLPLTVPAGLVCPTPVCTVNTPDAQFAHGPEVLSSAFFPIDPTTGYRIFFGDRPAENMYAIITLFGTDDRGFGWSKRLNPVTIMQWVVTN